MGPLLWPSWAYRGEGDLGVIPQSHIVQLDGDPEDHTDGEASLSQVIKLQDVEGRNIRALAFLFHQQLQSASHS